MLLPTELKDSVMEEVEVVYIRYWNKERKSASVNITIVLIVLFSFCSDKVLVYTIFYEMLQIMVR
ncbi:hypothetical protein BLOT_002219 [Blomia tropicalis]|nr:hypothetical protein BLOT_002219 [Blomia tropicalis]